MRPPALCCALACGVLVLLGAGRPAGAQDRAATERRLQALRAQIEGVEEQVLRARSEEAGALAAVEGLEAEIALREQLVDGYRTRLDTLRTETTSLRGSITRLEDEIDAAKTSYRRRARHAYIRGRLNDLALILSSNSLSQALARARYLRRFAQQRRRQVERHSLRTFELRERESALQGTLLETQRMLTTSRSEQAELAERRRDRERLVAVARSERAQFERELAQRRADADALEGLVRELVAEARVREADAARRLEEARQRQEAETARRQAEARARAEAEAEARRTAEARADRRMVSPPRRTPTPRRDVRPATPPPATRAAPRTAPPAASPAAVEPEAAEPEARPSTPPESRPETIAGSFRSNRGRLPWPADGTVTGNFGTRTDPVYGTRIQSLGVDITTAPGAAVRAVFGGTVERVGVMSAFGTYVMVSHGGHTTIYGNLSEVDVRQGQRVQAGQAVGRAGTAAQRRGAALFFAVFDGEDAVDPIDWLRRR